MSILGLPLFVLLCILLATTASCFTATERFSSKSNKLDTHSFSKPNEVLVQHLDLNLVVDFKQKKLRGKVSLHIENLANTNKLFLDSSDLEIKKITLGLEEVPTNFHKGENEKHLGEPLIISIGTDTRIVHIYYSTSPMAKALQWLEPEQTTGKNHPFLLSQSQAILARSWIPCQDTPSVRITYTAQLQVPTGFMAVMSASNPTSLNKSGIYNFKMTQPIPSYLLAIAVGDFRFQSIGPRTGVYAELELLENAAWELADTETMIKAAEKLYGPYRWDRYDLIVLPPSFPFGGMENPRITFLTPTILAGDRSLVSLIAHELAHSWSGNMVTNKTWDDFWLNEGFTTYFEHRIMEEVYGHRLEEMLSVLELSELRKSLDLDFKNRPRDTWLHLNLSGRDPEDGLTVIPYSKGYFFLRSLENTIGRSRWDAFLRLYFDQNAFQTMDSKAFLSYIREHLIGQNQNLEKKLQLEAWIYGPGLPSNCPNPVSEELEQVHQQVNLFLSGAPSASLSIKGWTTHHFLYFLHQLPPDLLPTRLADLDHTFGFTKTKNSEILHAWLLLSLQVGYSITDEIIEEFLIGQGRRKFLIPLYRHLSKTQNGLEKARRIYEQARPGYHGISRQSVEKILGIK